jgi:hypothetical protein
MSCLPGLACKKKKLEKKLTNLANTYRFRQVAEFWRLKTRVVISHRVGQGVSRILPVLIRLWHTIYEREQ